MSYTDYYTPTNWENYPSENTAINATRLNHLEDGVDELDNRIVNLSTNKSEVSWNQTLIAGQKIAEITINGIQKNVYAPEISDSIVEEAEEQALKAEGYAVGEQDGIPVSSGTYYHNNAKYYSEESADDALISEGYANGTQNGEDVDPDSPYYHNNAKFWSEQKAGTVIKNTTGRFYTTTGGMLDSCVVALSPKQSGSGTPSPSNIRAITGHPSGEVFVNGKNFLPLDIDAIKSANTGGSWSGNVYTQNNLTFTILTDNDGNVTAIKASGTPNAESTLYISFKGIPTGDYYFNGCANGGSDSNFDMFCWDGTTSSRLKKWNGTTNSSSIYNDSTSSEIKVSDSTHNMTLRIRVRSGYQANNLMFCPMIRLGNVTDATFEPYQAQDITIQFGGTYYGGTFDFVSGVLTVTDVKKVLNGGATESWLKSTLTNCDIFLLTVSDADFSKEFILDKFESTTSENKNTVGWAWKGTSNTQIRIGFSTYGTTTVDAFKTWLASNNVELCYKLATPIEIQLSPSQINTLVGQNNLSAPLEGQSFASAEYRDNMSVVYITDERVVGKWIDGKDIYQRTIDLGSSGVSVPANSSASTGLAKGNVALPIWSTAISPSGQAFPYIGCSVGSTYIMMENKTGNATMVRYFTFQYTKS